jgi:hypothetical protein
VPDVIHVTNRTKQNTAGDDWTREEKFWLFSQGSRGGVQIGHIDILVNGNWSAITTKD